MSKTTTAAEQLAETGSTEPISVAICYPGGRLDKLTIPMEAAGLDVTVAPDDPHDHDVIMLDMPGSSMLRPLLDSDETPVVYRIRGNLWRASNYWTLGELKSQFSDRVLFPRLDGAVPADSHLESEFRNRTGNTTTDAIGLAVQPEQWPSVEHTDDELRLVTLTNADYHGKVDPIVERVGVVDDVLAETGGQWVIGGDGRFEDELAAATADADHVEYRGFIDAEAWLSRSNVLFHPSEFDIQVPNAILEGMASGLPVVTTAFPPFAEHRRLRSPRSHGELRNTLETMRDPDIRQQEADRNLAYVRDEHSPEAIGRQYRQFFESL